jgi:diguanylate cyclase (GGDEF)-like protein
MLGRLFTEFIFSEDIPLLAAGVHRASAPDVLNDSVTMRMLKKDGSLAWIEGNARIIRDSATGEVQGYVALLRDVTERKLLEDKLSALAMTDGLTGIANRRAFDEALEREWKRTLRDGSQISLLLLDIDRFKAFNDNYGHQVGDDCLRSVAVAVTGAVRSTDIAARYGGEEIAIILPNTGMDAAAAVAEKIRAAVEALQLSHKGNPEGGGHITVSIGAATALARIGGTIRMPESLLLSADNALYKAKHEGRNRVATTLIMAPTEA